MTSPRSEHDAPLPRVSIGMPVYNGEKHLRTALDSLLGQTFRDFELIISDNASTDATEAICTEYADRDERIRYVRQTSNLGAAANFQFVLRQARAPLFMWAAHDDWLDPDWIETLVPVADRPATIAFGVVQVVSNEGQPVAHPANGRAFDFLGPRRWRRWRYATEPAHLGKANPIYGLFPASALGGAAFDPFRDNGSEGDVMLLYTLLGTHELRCAGRVRIHKRSAVKVNSGSTSPARTRRGMVSRSMLKGFLRYADTVERFALWLSFPLTVLRFILGKLQRRLAPREVRRGP